MRFRKSIFILSMSALLLPAVVWASYPAEVARTGQTKCYADNGTEKSCAGTGQDGAIQAGAVWPDPRFSERADGTVTDNLTGLVWAKNANLLGTVDADNDTDGTAGDGAVTWQHALDYIKRLNRLTYLGHNDWRLPNVNELESLVHAGVYNPALPTNPFLNVQSFDYDWSSTSNANYTDYAWVVDMIGGHVGNDLKTNYFFVWPVRSGQCGSFDYSIICLPKTGQTTCYNSSGTVIGCTGTGQDGDLQKGVDWPDLRFTDHGDNTTTDNLTGLVWAKHANLMVTRDPTFDADDTANDGRVTWQHALDYVAKLNSENYLSHTDWRLPNRRELRSLADYALFNPALPSGHPFTQVQSSYYWSSTSSAYYKYYAWTVGMNYGIVNYGDRTDDGYVWPVRSGQVGNPIITTTTTTVGSTTTVPTTTTVLSTTTSTISTTTTTIGGTTTTTTVSGKPCPIAKTLGENNPKLDNLRDFRDSSLAQSAIGRKAIQIYYNNADSIDAALERSPALRAVTRKALEVIAPMVGKN